MKLDGRRPLTGHVTTDSPLALSLTGHWARHVVATIDGQPADVQRAGHVVTIAVPTGEHDLAFERAG